MMSTLLWFPTNYLYWVRKERKDSGSGASLYIHMIRNSRQAHPHKKLWKAGHNTCSKYDLTTLTDQFFDLVSLSSVGFLFRSQSVRTTVF
ncbi:hypothetical protein MPTK1_2g23990 [Marchantia polymorpha subsp. ruderalis]|uniref:Uncharacterized protein n=1 Tax=Marchantia polymorpha TaxID=3197 RepID=A0A2R6WPC2_MARPO|nr:hypothetical protein MARPO_0069s0047 [Marchantia polymorpha]BBN03503.1 hypothetical protein Mp_2g23990 [Marchantia polymorpha subsp. ruderalis]|eukprot:PTQ35708.1 hypothetical protein MARPO_0069s0047 [Marchantia polymorpha]